MTKTRYLNDEEKQFIVEKFQAGFDTVQIGKMLDRSDSTIGRFLKKMDMLLEESKHTLKQF